MRLCEAGKPGFFSNEKYEPFQDTHDGFRAVRQSFVRPNRLLWVLILGALLVFGLRCWYLYQKAQLKYLQVTLQSSVTGQAQLYYDQGYGFNEHDSVMVHVKKDSQPLWGGITMA